MSYYVEVHPSVRDRLNDLPAAVRQKAIEWLLGFEEEPTAGAYEDPVVGYARIFTHRHEDFLWRLVFTLEIDEDAETVGVTSVVVNPPH